MQTETDPIISPYYGAKEARADFERNHPESRVKRERRERSAARLFWFVDTLSQALLVTLIISFATVLIIGRVLARGS